MRVAGRFLVPFRPPESGADAGAAPGPTGYRWCMTQPRPDSEADVSALLAAAGITVTDEGKARARRRLAEARQRWTLERWARLREQLGLPPRTA